MGDRLLTGIYEKLLADYGAPRWWPANTPYEVIVGAILTQNTAWGNVEKAIANFGGGLTPERVLRLSPDELSEIIRPAGFYTQKSAYLHAATRWFEQYSFDVETVGRLPAERARRELLAVKGVGRETADAILLYAFGFPSFVVDAYTMRLLSRLPIPISGAKSGGYEAVKAYFESRLPRSVPLYNNYHALIVIHAKERCHKRQPACEGCPLMEMCAFGADCGKKSK
ncbi:MAG: endonuclease [Clostridiales bacterium]|jgi:endonuclease-3 related protein|nr:endonuclease [Clostridiales bacterium]